MLLEISFDPRLVSQLFDLQPDAVVWYKPVLEKAKIVDFEFGYCNAAASNLFGVPPGEVIGSSVLHCTFFDDFTREMVLQQCTAVMKDGTPVEFTYFSPIFKSYLNVQRSKALNGILSITRDRTQQVFAEQEKEKQSHLLQTIANASPTCIVLCEAMRDETQGVIDFRFLMANDKFAGQMGRTKDEIVGMTYCALRPCVKTNGLLSILGEVVNTGKTFRHEVFFGELGGWSHLTAGRVDEDKVIAIFLDVNETRKDKTALQEQAEWFNNILSHSPSGIIALEAVRDNTNDVADFEIRLANAAGKSMAGLPEQPVGKKLLELFPSFQNNGFLGAYKNVLQTGTSFTTETPFRRDAGKGWLQMTVAKLNDGLIINLSDISDLKLFQETIRSQAKELESILDASLNGMFACEAVRDESGRITDFTVVKINAAFTKILHFEPSEVIGKRYTEVFPAILNTGLIEMHADVVESGKSIQIEQFYKDNKIEGWFLLSISKWGENGFVQTFYDYTKLKQLQQQLELTIKGLQQSNERLSEFSHVASHDLNEPLRKVITFSKLLNDRFGNSLESGAKDYLERIEKTALRMQSLLENLLIYSRVTRQINTFQTFSLNQVVHDVVTDLETYISQRNAKIKVSTLPEITGERIQLRQLFQNLITNAVKFQAPGNEAEVIIRHAGTRKIERDGVAGKMYEVIEIQDNGIGFESSEAEKIFQLFHRLHPRHEYEGTGIGLAIVQRTMENHQGFAEAESEPGKGSTFRLYFPK